MVTSAVTLSRRWRRSICCVLVVAAALAACGDGDGGPRQFNPPDPPQPLARVSDRTSLDSGCEQQPGGTGTVYASSEVEPQIAVNPVNPQNFIGTWQQDRWSNGGARGDVAAVSFDAGQSWSIRTAPFSRCTGGNSVNGGDYARATDPWVTFGPDGTAWWMAMSITGSISAMLVSRSIDGGDSWQPPVVLVASDTPLFNDKNSITADPTDANHAYAVWDQLDASTNTGPVVFTRTTDGGDSWEPVREIYDPGFGAQTVGSIVAVLPDGTLLNVFTEIHFDSGQPDSSFLQVLRSTDRGATWSAPVFIDDLLAVGTLDQETGDEVRSGSILASIAVGPGPGDVWVAWQDSRFSSIGCGPACFGFRDSIVLARSGDGGLTWGDPVLVPQDPQVQAFTPTVQVTSDGTLGVSYYDFRDDPGDNRYLLTSYWLATSDDGVNWTERLISGPFDLALAPDALGLFLGDYAGLGRAGADFVPFFAQTQPSTSNRTNIYSVVLPAAVTAVAKAALRTYAAYGGPPIPITAEHRERVRYNFERRRKHFPDHTQPWLLPQYLRLS